MRLPITGDPRIDARTIAWAKRLIAAQGQAKAFKVQAIRRIKSERAALRFRVQRARRRMRDWLRLVWPTLAALLLLGCDGSAPALVHAPDAAAVVDNYPYVITWKPPFPENKAVWCHKPADFLPDANPWACAPAWVARCCAWNVPAPVTSGAKCTVHACQGTDEEWRHMDSEGQAFADPDCECEAFGPDFMPHCIAKSGKSQKNWWIAGCE